MVGTFYVLFKMTETGSGDAVVASPASTKTSTKAKKATPQKNKGASKPKVASTHPPTASMVNSAIKSLNERGGSSLQAIKKYISSTYKVDAEKIAPFIKKYLKSAADKGALVRTKGKGAAGSFKLPGAKSEVAKKQSKAAIKKSKPAASTKKVAVKPKKTKSPKKAASKPAAVKPKTVKKATTPKKVTVPKAKQPAKSPTPKKVKSPKPKKAAPKKTVKKPATKK